MGENITPLAEVRTSLANYLAVRTVKKCLCTLSATSPSFDSYKRSFNLRLVHYIDSSLQCDCKMCRLDNMMKTNLKRIGHYWLLFDRFGLWTCLCDIWSPSLRRYNMQHTNTHNNVVCTSFCNDPQQPQIVNKKHEAVLYWTRMDFLLRNRCLFFFP